MTDVSKPKPKLWMPEDLAEYLSVPVGWVYKRTQRHGPEMIPHIKLGKYLRFDPSSSAFQEWLSSHTATAESDENLTSSHAADRVRAKEKKGQILTKGESVYGS